MVWKTAAHPQYAHLFEVLYRNDDGKPVAGITQPEEGDMIIAMYSGVSLGLFPTPELARAAVEAYQFEVSP